MFPAPVKTRVMPSFCAMTLIAWLIPSRSLPWPSARREQFSFQQAKRPLKLDFHIDARGEIELHQSVHRLRCWIDNVEDTLMRPDFKLFARLLIDVR